MSNSRLDDLRIVDPVLTQISQGYANNALIYNQIFPTVSVGKMKGKVPYFSKEAFVIRSTERALRGNSNRIPPIDFSLVDFTTKEKDIEIAIDYLEEEESNSYKRYEVQITKNLTDILEIGKEKEAADLLQTAGNYISALKVAIDSDSAFNDYSNSVDPISFIRTGMEAVRARIARYPNTMIMGNSTFTALKDHPKILERVRYTGIAKTTVDMLKDICDVPNILIGNSVYTSDGSTFSDIWGDNIVLAYIDQSSKKSRSEFNPSLGYTFQREGKPEVDTYYENGGKIKVIRNTDNYGIMVTSSDAAYLISDTNH